ncbi:MAG: hypothetical protein AB4372_30400 [Xenococcus sp. (in: cyanobacteria)]
MIKKLTTVILTVLIISSSVSIVNQQSAKANHLNQSITIYSVTINRHGRILRTSVGTFYLGKSGDVIYETSGGKIYGYWEYRSSGSAIEPDYNYIYLGNRFYYLQEDKFTGDLYLIRTH